jgi:hypothetical protein
VRDTHRLTMFCSGTLLAVISNRPNVSANKVPEQNIVSRYNQGHAWAKGCQHCKGIFWRCWMTFQRLSRSLIATVSSYGRSQVKFSARFTVSRQRRIAFQYPKHLIGFSSGLVARGMGMRMSAGKFRFYVRITDPKNAGTCFIPDTIWVLSQSKPKMKTVA